MPCFRIAFFSLKLSYLEFSREEEVCPQSGEHGGAGPRKKQKVGVFRSPFYGNRVVMKNNLCTPEVQELFFSSGLKLAIIPLVYTGYFQSQRDYQNQTLFRTSIVLLAFFARKLNSTIEQCHDPQFEFDLVFV